MAKQEIKNELFVNPFEKGVNYAMFLDAVGTQSVADYCKNKLSQSQIDWLIEDLKHFTNK